MRSAQYLILSDHERYDGGDGMQRNFAQAYLEEFKLQPIGETGQTRSRTRLLPGNHAFNDVAVVVTTLATLSLVDNIARAFRQLHDRWLRWQSSRASGWGRVRRDVRDDFDMATE